MDLRSINSRLKTREIGPFFLEVVKKNRDNKRTPIHLRRESQSQYLKRWFRSSRTESSIFMSTTLKLFERLNERSWAFQKQPFRDALSKRCSGNMLQIYRGTPMPKWDFNKVGFRSNEIKKPLPTINFCWSNSRSEANSTLD